MKSCLIFSFYKKRKRVDFFVFKSMQSVRSLKSWKPIWEQFLFPLRQIFEGNIKWNEKEESSKSATVLYRAAAFTRESKRRGGGGRVGGGGGVWSKSSETPLTWECESVTFLPLFPLKKMLKVISLSIFFPCSSVGEEMERWRERKRRRGGREGREGED